MTILQKQDGDKGLFNIIENNKQVALLTYQLHYQQMVIDHTEVDENLQGNNVGFKLVEQAVNYARQNHLKVLPLCVFAKAVIAKTPTFQDVL